SQYRGVLSERQVSTVFFGGGTPSLLTSDQVNQIIETISAAGTLLPDAEISLEANPEMLTEDILRGYREAGVNRLSLGLQSTHEALLTFLGRHHSPADFYHAVESARKAGFSNISGDLIFGIPGQSLDSWHQSLEKMVQLQLDHLSCYGLTYEKGTPLFDRLFQNQFQAVDEDLEWKMFRHAIDWLQAQGYDHYEISNYAKPGNQCRHNLTYWKNREYLGVGAGAHGFLNGERYENTVSLEEYVKRLKEKEYPVANRQRVSLRESVSETCFLSLRLREGISESAFQHRYGRSLMDFYPVVLPRLMEKRLLVREDGRVRLTETGIDFSNQVFTALMLDENAEDQPDESEVAGLTNGG
ncbi:MAG: radical SAM family heme chaperone HemW, partial [Bacillota bacterium]|nr:radical SAM family heme chaperone HemW [Bacillota bacterium]